MNIGEKIKNLRTSKLMTQKELAGEEVTRNMLSQIENGSAMPSLRTLNYLASRLGVPVGYLITDGSANETFYRKYSNYSNLIESYRSGEWAICRDLCLACFADRGDSEIAYMLSQASMHIGISCFNSGRLKMAVKMFDEGIEYARLTVFDTGGILSTIISHSEIMLLISPTLTLEIPEEMPESDIFSRSDICKFSSALLHGAHYGERDWKNSGYFYILSARSLIEKNNFEAAIALLSHVFDDNSLPSPIMYLVLDDYEKCCKEIEDYKSAYEISQAKLQLFEKMLADE